MWNEKEMKGKLDKQISEEILFCWNEELQKDLKFREDKRKLDHGKKLPELLVLWENNVKKEVLKKISPYDALKFQARNELGDAELLIEVFKGKYVYDHQAKKWFVWNGVRFIEDKTDSIARVPMNELAVIYEQALYELNESNAKELEDCSKEQKELSSKIEQEEDEEEKEKLRTEYEKIEAKIKKILAKGKKATKNLGDRANQLRTLTRSQKVVSTASKGANSLGITGEEWEQEPTLFVAANGVIDLETGKLLQPRYEQYLKKGSSVPYMGLLAFSDFWDEHLQRVFCQNQELIDYFEYCIGASVTGLRTNKDIWCAYGPEANNGKSSTFNPILKIIGDYGTTIKVDLLLDETIKGSKGPDVDMMVIDGLRMGVASEAGDKARFSSEKIKAITGGDEIRARGMFENSRIIQSTTKLWLHTNTIPKISSYDPGFMLRLKVIPFLAKFTSDLELLDERKHIYAAKNQEEFKRLIKEHEPYILSWVIRCARKYLLNQNYKTPELVKSYTATYFEDNDLIGQFLKERTEPNDMNNNGIQVKDLYDKFMEYCKDEHGIQERSIKSMKSFVKEVENHGHKKKVLNKSYFTDLKLKTETLKKNEGIF